MLGQNYLISFLATIKGHKAVVTAMRTMQRQIGHTGEQSKKAAPYSAQLIKALKRVAVVVPVWMAFRAVLRTVTAHIRMVVTALIDLDEAMARLRTVTHGTTQDIERDIGMMRKMIIDTAIKTRASIKDLGEMFYFLKTANLEANEAMAAFIPTLNAMVGTGNAAKDTARAVAGMYNTMGKYLGDNLTVHEKFQKIADVLTYTYATQDVQLSELVAGYTKLAPYLSGLDDDFETIVATLGFLNTQLLRGGRTGRLLGRSFLQLGKNSDKLADIFGITFDPDKPLNFHDTITKLNEKIKISTKLTFAQQDALRKVFETRGAVPVRLLVEYFGDLEKAIKDTKQSAGGFAQRMHDIKLDTIKGQLERMKNILIATDEAFLIGLTGADSFKDALKEINESLKDARYGMLGFAVDLKTIAHNAWVAAQAISFIGAPQTLELIKTRQRFREIGEELENNTKELRAYIQEQKGLSVSRLEMEVTPKFMFLSTNVRELEKEYNNLQEQMEKLTFKDWDVERNQAIDKYMERQKTLLGSISEQKAEEEKQKAIKEDVLKLLQQEKDAQGLILAKMKALGATNLQIEVQRLQFMKESVSTEEQLRKQKMKTATVALQALRKEANLVTDLAMRFQKADLFERERIRRRIELRGKTPEQLATLFQDSAFDRRVIEEGWGSWGDVAEREIAKVISRMYGLDIEDVIEELEAMELQLPTEEITSFWDFYKQEGKKAIAEVFAEFSPMGEEMANRTITWNYPEDFEKQLKQMKTLPSIETTAKPLRKEIINNIEVYTNIDIPLIEIEAQLSPEEIGEAVKEKVIEQIENQEVIKKIREEI